jgi:CheY-like chemotaxis protein
MAKILIVDDEPSLREIVRLMLERAGYQVIEAEEGAGALMRYSEHRPDLVVTDILMPGRDGLEALREIREMDPGARIIVMSGGGENANTSFLELAEKLGAVASLEKPFTAADLLAVVARVLTPDPASL